VAIPKRQGPKAQALAIPSTGWLDHQARPTRRKVHQQKRVPRACAKHIPFMTSGEQSRPSPPANDKALAYQHQASTHEASNRYGLGGFYHFRQP
jgi:hypothetical protein